MFELLLQADKALADGALDQAEQTYLQLIELDPTNAIAVAGLARVAQERGDEQLALALANRAIAIDPESVSARRVLEALEPGGAQQVEVDLPDLPLVAAERLEALSGHGRAAHAPDEGAGSSAAQAEGSSERSAPEGRREAAGEPAGGDRPGAKHAKAADAGAAHPETGPGRARRPISRPDVVLELPSEPLTDRRQAGRLAAAAAAAAATAMPRAARRAATWHEPHHAMPSGKRRFEADELRAPVPDAYSAAESAAAAEAVDALDVAEQAPEEGAEQAPEEVPGRVSGVADVLGAVDAAAAEESVAMRIARVAGATELSATETEAAERIEAKAAAADENGAFRIALVGNTIELEASEPETTWVLDEEESRALEVAEAAATVEAVEADAAESEAVEAETARPASKGTLEAPSAKPDEPVEQEARPRPPHVGGAGEPSEKDAETQALREALAIVLGSKSEAGWAEPASAADRPPLAATEAEDPDESPARGETAGPTRATGPTQATEPAQPAPQTEPEPASRRKKGLFRRFGGS